MATNRWISAARLRTLPLTFSCILLGTALAAEDGFFSGLTLFGCLLTALLFQVLSNFANDYGDGIRGTDAERTGEARAVASGLISPEEMRRAVLLMAILSFVSATALSFWATRNLGWLATLAFVLLGLAAIWAAITYTVGKRAYGYKGMGDLYVLAFFGFVGVGGSYFLQAATLDPLIFLPATSVGLFSVGVLNLNNMRDIVTDEAAGKITLPVRLGLGRAKVYHAVLLLLGWDAALLFNFLKPGGGWHNLYWLALPLFLFHLRTVIRSDARGLDPQLKRLALSTLLFVLLFSLSRLL